MQVNSFSFTAGGLTITYTEKGITTLSFDPLATCDLFEKTGIVEGFDIDKNNEPVILFTDDSYGRPAPGFCLWCDYVRTFRFIQRHAEIIIEARENCKAFRKSKGIIENLLRPLTYINHLH